MLPISADVKPGEILGESYGFSDNSSGIVVGTNDNALIITELEDENGDLYKDAELHSLHLEGVFDNE